MSCRGETGLLLVLICLFLVWSQRIQSRGEEEDLEKQLKILNKPFVKSIKDEYGNIFDCVGIYKQPAFDHPLLKNHTIKIPNIRFANKIVSKPSTKEKQVNFGFKERCPSGTVLIRRTTIKDLVRARKYGQYFHVEDAAFKPPEVHRAYLIMQDIKYYGARADMDIFNYPISKNQVSAAQVIVMKGVRGPKNYVNAVHFGWRIDPRRSGDNFTHFFIQWTSDGYQKRGCIDMLCPGFIQLSRVIAPGMVLPGKSVITLNTYREPNKGNWVLVREDNGYELIGYWPKEIFNNMADCSDVQMGGVTYSPLNEPSPPMGNGLLPRSLLGSSAKFKRVELLTSNGGAVKPSEVNNKYFSYDRALSDYYQAGYELYTRDGYTFMYGGPGKWTGKKA